MLNTFHKTAHGWKSKLFYTTRIFSREFQFDAEDILWFKGRENFIRPPKHGNRKLQECGPSCFRIYWTMVKHLILSTPQSASSIKRYSFHCLTFSLKMKVSKVLRNGTALSVFFFSVISHWPVVAYFFFLFFFFFSNSFNWFSSDLFVLRIKWTHSKRFSSLLFIL